VRFDFFRRLLADYLGNLVEKGEYDEAAAIAIAIDVSYGNIAKALSL
jgi:glucuronate isomerase